MKTCRQKFHESHGLPENACLDLHQLASLSGFPEDALRLVYRRGVTVKPGSKGDPFAPKAKAKAKAKPKTKPLEEFSIGPAGKGAGFTRIYTFITGKFKKDRDIAIMYGLVTEEAAVPKAVPVVRPPSPVLSEWSSEEEEEESSDQYPDW